MFTLIFIIKRLSDHDQPQKLYVRLDIKRDIAPLYYVKLKDTNTMTPIHSHTSSSYTF